MNRLIREIHHADVVSFDIFDTLILRKLEEPSDLFRLMELELQAEYPNDEALQSFFDKRIQAESEARKYYWEISRKTEITLDDIYNKLIEQDNRFEDKIQFIKEKEIELETRICTRNPYMYEIYQQCIKRNIKIVFTSDMYLSYETIESILKKNGYNKYYKLYLSSSLGLTKSTGELFEHVIKDLDISPEKILHIGDNMNSDVKKAQEKNINAYHYKKCADICDVKNLLHDESMISKVYNGLIINKLYSSRGSCNVDFWHEFGYKYVGILYYGFISWLQKKISKLDLDKYYFFSRDGYIMKEVYELMYPEEKEKLKYLYASRRAFNFASIKNLDEDSMNFLVSGTSRLTVKQFLERIGIDAEDYKRQIESVGFTGLEHVVDNGKEYEMLRNLYHELSDVIIARAHDERSHLVKYLNQEEIINNDRIAVIDIGWHGSMQYSFELLLESIGKKHEAIKGYYLATYHNAKKYSDNGLDLEGYLCNLGEPKENLDTIKLCVEMFEFMFTAPHGSVIKFIENNKTVIPIMDEDSEKNKIEIVKRMQQGALEFVVDIHSVLRTCNEEVPNWLSIEPIKRILQNPSNDELRYVGDLEHAEGFGDVYIKRYFAKPSNRIGLLLNPKKAALEYKRAYWRNGYKKRLVKFF